MIQVQFRITDDGATPNGLVRFKIETDLFEREDATEYEQCRARD